MIQVCYYKGCGVIYGEKKPLSDKRKTHGLCPKHLKISLREIKVEMEKLRANGKTESFQDIKIHEAPGGGKAHVGEDRYQNIFLSRGTTQKKLLINFVTGKIIWLT